MTSNIRILLAQIATFEQQHKAGLNPPCSALAEFFETARLARLDVDAVDRGFVDAPRPLRTVGIGETMRDAVASLKAAPPSPASRVAVDRIEGQAVQLVARVPLALMARAVLEELGAASAPEVPPNAL